MTAMQEPKRSQMLPEKQEKTSEGKSYPALWELHPLPSFTLSFDIDDSPGPTPRNKNWLSLTGPNREPEQN
eukprot:g60551.t1